MGNQVSSYSSSKRRSSRKAQTTAEQAAERAKRVVGDLQEGIKNSVKKLDDDHPAAQLLDHVCGTYYHDDDKYRNSRSASYYSEDASEDGSRTFQSEDDTTYDGRRGRKSDRSVDSRSYMTQSDYDSDSRRRGRGTSFDTEDESRITHEAEPKLISKPLASSFAKRCYFTKSGIGKTTQHYEGLTLTGNVVLMLASAMKLKGCPTICDEDLRRVEQTYPNQFSRLPDELLLSSGWRRISKYCHFSNKSIPDGIPFFHSKQRLHPSGGYYFLLAASVGMIRPMDIEPLTKDTLVLLETDYPNQCDVAPNVLIQDPDQWVLVNKFCFFSGGPINTEEDVYYRADFDGNPIYMLAFLSPSLTPEELYKLTETGSNNEPGLKTIDDVQEVESVYDLTDRDFDDLKLYHLGPCRALPQYILQPSAWTKVLPPHFLAARQHAMLRANDYNAGNDPLTSDKQSSVYEPEFDSPSQLGERFTHEVVRGVDPSLEAPQRSFLEGQMHAYSSGQEFMRDAEEEGAFHSSGLSNKKATAPNQKEPFSQGVLHKQTEGIHFNEGSSAPCVSRMDPPDDEPPSLKIESMEENKTLGLHHHTSTENQMAPPPIKTDINNQGFLLVEPASDHNIKDSMVNPSDSLVLSEFESHNGNDEIEDFDLARHSETPKNIEDNHDFEGEAASPSKHQFRETFKSPTHDNYSKSRRSQRLTQDNENEPRYSDDYVETSHGNDENLWMRKQQNQERSVNDDEFPYDSGFQDAGSPHVLPNPSEEKKDGNEKEDVDSDLNSSEDMTDDKFNDPDEESETKLKNSLASNGVLDSTIEPIDTSFTKSSEHNRNLSPFPYSPAGMSTSSGRGGQGSHQSPAMRGAHEILKRNRRRRAEGNRSGTKESKSVTTPAQSDRPESTRSSADAWDENATDIAGSAVSGSSVLTDNSGPSERNSRRQLILQMAKARMKNNRDSQSQMSSPMNGEGDEADETVFTEANATVATHDFDLTGDLD